MKHLRADYDGIQDWPTKRVHRETSIGEDEPVFIIRANDPSAEITVRAWADDAARRGADPELVRRVRAWASSMGAYGRLPRSPEHQVADVPDGDLRRI